MRHLLLLSRFRLSALLLALGTAGVYALACGDSEGSNGEGSNDGDGGGGTVPDAEIVPSDAGALGTTMRLAHLSSDLGAVDFCYRMAKTSSFEGPVLGGGLGTITKDAGYEGGDGGDAGVAEDGDATIDDAGGEAGAEGGAPAAVIYGTVSKYLTLDAAGPLEIELVAPGATSCATPLFVADVTLDPGKLSTVAIVGRHDATDAGASTLALVAFTDDRTTIPSKARVRMIHAALGKVGGREASGPLAVRAQAAQTVTIAERVEPKKAASPSAAVPVDALGYATILPLPSPTHLAVGAAANTTPGVDASSVDSWVSNAAELGMSGSSLHTGFIVTGDNKPFQVLWCTDTSTSGDETTCALVE
jgi:hypothetical protein